MRLQSDFVELLVMTILIALKFAKTSRLFDFRANKLKQILKDWILHMKTLPRLGNVFIFVFILFYFLSHVLCLCLELVNARVC